MNVLATTLGALLLLAACASPAAQAPPSFTSCEAAAAYFKGQVGGPLTHAVTFTPHRILLPNSIVTMDFNPHRLNVYTDDQGNIIDARCG